MAHLLSDLANYFNLEETNIDNWTFKLYYKVSMVICMTGATVGIASQYFGDPIRWDDADIILDIEIVFVDKLCLWRIHRNHRLATLSSHFYKEEKQTWSLAHRLIFIQYWHWPTRRVLMTHEWMTGYQIRFSLQLRVPGDQLQRGAGLLLDTRQLLHQTWVPSMPSSFIMAKYILSDLVEYLSKFQVSHSNIN